MSAEQAESTPTHTPEYRSGLHYPHGSDILFEAVVKAGGCYINLEDDHICPRCSSDNTRILESGKFATDHSGRVWARVVRCDDCRHAYVTAEAID